MKNHKLKHGLISTIEKDMIINNLRSSDPDTVLQTINSKELEIMSVNYASYDFTDEEENLVDMYRQFKDIPEIEQRSKLEIIKEQSMPGATKDNVLSDILKSQSNDNYNTAEMQALPDMMSSGIFPGQLLVEFHYNYQDIGFDQFLYLIQSLRDNGYRILDISERGYEFSFVHEQLL